jgi:hypothetical protein
MLLSVYASDRTTIAEEKLPETTANGRSTAGKVSSHIEGKREATTSMVKNIILDHYFEHELTGQIMSLIPKKTTRRFTIPPPSALSVVLWRATMEQSSHMV